MAKMKTPPTLTHPWRSVTDLKDALSRAREIGAKHRAHLAEMNGRVDTRRKELESTLSDVAPSQRAQIVNRAVGGLKADLLHKSRDARVERLRALDAVRHEASDARVHYSSSIQMLMREGLGGERRSRLMQQLEHSGGVELASLAALAAATKDRELAAALVSRANRIPHAERSFSAQELADLVVGDEHRAIHAAVMEIAEVAERALVEDRAFETGRAPTAQAIGLALRGRDRAELGVPEDALDRLAAKQDQE